jgi:hypothetical protein
MSKIAVCSTTIKFTQDIQTDIKEKLGLDNVDFFSDNSPADYRPYYKVLGPDSCYNLATPEFRNHLFKTMMVCEQKKTKELATQSFYEACFLLEDNILNSEYHLKVPEFLNRHTLYGIPDLIMKQQHSDRWREKFNISPDFFFSDTTTFNVVCDAYRFLYLPKSFLKFSMLEFQYKYLIMNGITFRPGVNIV